MDVIVTGLPRSGLTLAAALIDGLPNSICLNTPSWHLDLLLHSPSAAFCGKLIAGSFLWTRGQLLDKQPISDFRALDGTPLVDGLYDQKMPADKSGLQVEVVFSPATKLSGDFILGAKHHNFYTSLLPTLVKFRHFKIIAVIRHPIEIFAAWQKLPQPLLTKGNPMGITRFWPEAFDTAWLNVDNATKFAQLYDLYLKRYHELHEHIHIVKYEDIIDDPSIISRLFGVKSLPSTANLIKARTRRQFQASNTDQFRDAINKYGVYTKMYYKDL